VTVHDDAFSAGPFTFFASGHENDARFAPPRGSASATLSILRRGSVRVIIRGREHRLKTGSAIYTPTGAHPRGVCLTAVETLSIDIPPRYALPEAVVERTARAWALNVLAETQLQQPGWTLVVEGLVVSGLGYLARMSEREERRPSWVDDAVSLARQQRSLRDVAAILGMHPSHVARSFRAFEGVSIGEYARRCRLELARSALRQSDTPIADVAASAGFCDQSHFTRVFRRLFGVTPAEFRRTRSRNDGGR